MHVHQSLKGIVIAQVSECPSLMVKPTFCGQTRKVGNVPGAVIERSEAVNASRCLSGQLIALVIPQDLD